MNGSVRLHYVESGPSSDEPLLVFVPGLTDLAEDYLPILEEFGRRTVVVDLRGRGPSDAPETGYSLDDHASDIEAVVNAATQGQVHLATFSRGSCYALTWAFTNPDRVLSIAIGDYPAREVIFPSDHLDNFMASTWRGTPVEQRLSRRALEGIVASAVGRTFWDELAEFEGPVLVVRADGEGPITSEDWDRYATEVPRAELVTFKDSPHDIFRQDRLRFPRLVRELADSAERANR